MKKIHKTTPRYFIAYYTCGNSNGMIGFVTSGKYLNVAEASGLLSKKHGSSIITSVEELSFRDYKNSGLSY